MYDVEHRQTSQTRSIQLFLPCQHTSQCLRKVRQKICQASVVVLLTTRGLTLGL